jgi:phosphatidate cytidylyltransferase
MALNVQTFKTRSLTAVVFVAVMLAGLLINQWTFFILFSIIHFGCWVEYLKLTKKINPKKHFLYLPLGLLYITLPCVLMLELGTKMTAFTDNIPYDALFPCTIIFSLWINDTMQYIVGSLIGKTPFSKISPKKTWEGTIGGIILCIVVIALLGYFIPYAKQIEVKHWSAIAAIAAITGTAGDLLESKIKRMANVKDSGSIMPGHGGFLDRFDSLLVATPFVWLYIKLFLS